ncbi:NACHT domain-containing protein [Frankia sp. AgPm24]|uniref:NACHT domain-containing protein n=1 Tax=Frankia sp. AgPm24 TaxID=631128 RepID=UPI00200DF4E7|nr:NACHT domain-containing protein [Frankia sp. AgPm24]MCK9921976.1 NACHT domain-containing protein [Frankia sp. AgPm24]
MGIKRGRRKAPRSVWWSAGALGLIAGGVAWAAGQDKAAALVAGLGVLLPVAAFLADKIAARTGDLDIATVADRLADLVRDQWDIEARRRGVRGSSLEVFWQEADADLVSPWAELQRQAADGGNGPASATPGSGPGDLAGSGALLAAYERSPCKRLVMLGEAGAGKTVLLVRLVLDVLDRRQPGDPVPLLLPLAAWNPTGPSLYDWLESQILREYAHLAAVDSATGRTRAGALLDAGLILPVLDGLDEIFADGRDQVLVALNDGLRGNVGLIVSSRPGEFRAAVHPRPDWPSTHLAGAAGIHLTPLTAPAMGDYLLANAGTHGSVRWAPVLTALATPTSPLAQALTTPLAGSLASAIYNPRPRESTLGFPNPTDLTTLPTPDAVEQHLFAEFIPAAYRPHPDQPTPRWTPQQADRYLTFLARHLEHRLHTTSLAWWELHRAAPRALPVLLIGLGYGLLLGLLFEVERGFVDGLAGGLAGGLVFGLGGGLRKVSPSRTTLRRPQLSDLAPGFTGGLMCGLMCGLAIGIGAGLGAGLMGGLMVVLGLSTTADTGRAADPMTVLSQDRTRLLLFGLTVGLVVGLAFGLGFGPTVGVVAGLVVGLAFGLMSGLMSAWGRLGLARLWLAPRRQQPFHLIAFLEDARDRGVLRQAGAVWEFRHANLQRHLANRP